ncbi:hypothetical protein FISHEDRAFT_73606 [Fistulina hepatica ATCC 64428]|uniref:Uncharacterized protein n=1 Tax=Fistulina hepatica ATCC 64428 TaxID=1128425 RepID=A0A0D7ADC9_9AGAR|nr:hypothetical protein FISHEDRAFT_73606 [Fistulina hepatica ATCC 64428]
MRSRSRSVKVTASPDPVKCSDEELIQSFDGTVEGLGRHFSNVPSSVSPHSAPNSLTEVDLRDGMDVTVQRDVATSQESLFSPCGGPSRLSDEFVVETESAEVERTLLLSPAHSVDAALRNEGIVGADLSHGDGSFAAQPLPDTSAVVSGTNLSSNVGVNGGASTNTFAGMFNMHAPMTPPVTPSQVRPLWTPRIPRRPVLRGACYHPYNCASPRARISRMDPAQASSTFHTSRINAEAPYAREHPRLPSSPGFFLAPATPTLQDIAAGPTQGIPPAASPMSIAAHAFRKASEPPKGQSTPGGFVEEDDMFSIDLEGHKPFPCSQKVNNPYPRLNRFALEMKRARDKEKIYKSIRDRPRNDRVVAPSSIFAAGTSPLSALDASTAEEPALPGDYYNYTAPIPSATPTHSDAAQRSETSVATEDFAPDNALRATGTFTWTTSFPERAPRVGEGTHIIMPPVESQAHMGTRLVAPNFAGKGAVSRTVRTNARLSDARSGGGRVQFRADRLSRIAKKPYHRRVD